MNFEIMKPQIEQQPTIASLEEELQGYKATLDKMGLFDVDVKKELSGGVMEKTGDDLALKISKARRTLENLIEGNGPVGQRKDDESFDWRSGRSMTTGTAKVGVNKKKEEARIAEIQKAISEMGK